MPSSSASTSFGSSTSTPGPVNTPASDWELQLSQLLGNLGQYQYQWAMQQYQRTSDITDAQINNYIQAANAGMGMAGNLLGRYERTFAPMADQYAREAGTYASNSRIQHNMGAAESRAAQAGHQGLINAQQELQSYGIDPSSGRYQDLEMASHTATAASAAAAGEAARINTEQTGRQMRLNSIQIGQQMPGATVNALNSAYQGVAGAENAALGRANTGVNLTTSAHPYMSDAMAQQFPPVGNTSRSSQGSNSASMQPGGGPGRTSDPFNSDRFGRGSPNPGGPGSSPGGQQAPYAAPNGGRTVQAPSNIQQLNPGEDAQQQLGGFDPNNPAGTLDQTSRDVGGVLDDNQWGQGWPTGPGNNAYTDPGNWGNTNSDTGGIPYWTGGMDQSTQQSPQSGWDSSNMQPSGQNYGSWDSAAVQNYDSPSANWGSPASGGYYAKGGGVMPEQGGGHVPRGMSPSGGQQVDDVNATIPQTGGRAQLNVDEFVIPRDVAMWKGQEFFQTLIKKSREARTGAPAKPQRGP